MMMMMMRTLIAAAALFVGVFTSAYPAGAQVGDDLPLQVTLQPLRTVVAGTDAMFIEFRMTNTSGTDLDVLTWETPFGAGGNIFEIACGNSRPQYIGPIFKRADTPAPESYIRVGAGDTRTSIVNLDEYYAGFQPGVCTVTYKPLRLAVLQDLPATRLTGVAARQAPVRSNAVAFHVVTGRVPFARTTGVQLFSKTPTFNNCSSTEEDTLKKAVPKAEEIAKAATKALNDKPENEQPKSQRYTTWFGAHSKARYTKVTANFTKIRDTLSQKVIDFDCKGKSCSSDTYAYVIGSDPYKVYPCTLFWKADLMGTNSQSGTLVHEISHFNVVADTDDVSDALCSNGSNNICYGQTNAKALAAGKPDLAITNADNYEYFAENDPDVPM